MCPMGLHRNTLIKKAPMQENNKDEWGKYVLILEATFKLQISLFCKLGYALIGSGPQYSLDLFLWPMQGHTHTTFNQLKIQPSVVPLHCFSISNSVHDFWNMHYEWNLTNVPLLKHCNERPFSSKHMFLRDSLSKYTWHQLTVKMERVLLFLFVKWICKMTEEKESYWKGDYTVCVLNCTV